MIKIKLVIRITFLATLLSTFCAKKNEEGRLGKFPMQIRELPEGVSPENQDQEIAGSDSVTPAGIIARKSAWLRHHTQINTDVYVVGNCAGTGCLDPANPPTNPKAIDNSDSELTVGVSVTVPVNRTLKADKIRLKNNANVQGITEANKYAQAKSASIVHRQTELGALPKLPFFLKGTPGTLNVKDSATPLSSGKYASLTVRRQRSLMLEGGFYQLNDIDMKLESSLTCQTQCIVLVKVNFVAAKKIKLSATSGNPNDLLIYVEGGNAAANPMDAASKAVQLGGMSEVTANIYAPNGRLQFGSATIAKGAFIANHVRVEPNSIITQGPPPVGTIKLVEAGVPATVEIPGKVRLDIPACALTEDAIINVTPKPDAKLSANFTVDWQSQASTAFELLPSGLDFGCPVSLDQNFDASTLAINGVDQASLRVFASENGTDFYYFPGSLKNNGTIQSQINHFTIYLLASPISSSLSTSRIQRKDSFAYGITSSAANIPPSLITYNLSNPANIQEVSVQSIPKTSFRTEALGIYLQGNDLYVLISDQDMASNFYQKIRRYTIQPDGHALFISSAPVNSAQTGYFYGHSADYIGEAVIQNGKIYSQYYSYLNGKYYVAYIDISNPLAPSLTINDPQSYGSFQAYFNAGYLYRELSQVAPGIRVYDASSLAYLGDLPKPVNAYINGFAFGTNSILYATNSGIYIEDLVTPLTTTNTRFLSWSAISSYPAITYTQAIAFVNHGGSILLSVSGTSSGISQNGLFFLQEQPGALPTLIDSLEGSVNAVFGYPVYAPTFGPWYVFYPAGASGIRVASLQPDFTPPVTGSAITANAVCNYCMTINWGPATDDATPSASLQYKVVKDNFSPVGISTIALADLKTGGDLLQDWTANISSKTVTGLMPNTSYHFAVLVRDLAGNISIYTPTTQATTIWMFTGNGMAASRHGHTLTYLADGRILVTGGQGSAPAQTLASAEIFDATANGGAGAFIPTANMTAPRTGHTATLLADGRVLITGGYSGISVNSAEIFDPSGNSGAGSFVNTGSMISPRFAHAAARLPDGRILLSGGMDNFDTLLITTEIFDPTGNAGAGSFIPAAAMSAAKWGHAETPLSDGRILITGGSDFGGPLSSAEIFDAGTLTFTATAAMTMPRISHAPTLLLDGRVLITGGETATGVTASTEVFDPLGNAGAGSFSALSNMNSARGGHTATLRSDGTVLITGGIINATYMPTASVELFNPSAGTFAPKPSMILPKHNHLAVKLNDDRVLVVGGLGGSGELNTAEIFE